MIAYIEKIRDNHIQIIEKSSVTAIQVCEIEKGEIEETVEEIDTMIQDIESNMESILSDVNEEEYIECFEFYKQKEGLFSHRVEQLGTEVKEWPCTSGQKIYQKIKNFKMYMAQLYQTNDDQEEW